MRGQTVQRGGGVTERDDVHGRGFLRSRSQVRGLLYYRGFARPPKNVRAFARVWWSERRDDFAALRRSEGAEALSSRAVLIGPAASAVRSDVSPRVSRLISATRLVLVLALSGIALAALGAWHKKSDAALYLNYAATFAFIEAWAVARCGIWDAATSQAPLGGRGGWLRSATNCALR